VAQALLNYPSEMDASTRQKHKNRHKVPESSTPGGTGTFGDKKGNKSQPISAFNTPNFHFYYTNMSIYMSVNKMAKPNHISLLIGVKCHQEKK